MINILIAEDHALVREGLCRIIKSEPLFNVMGEAANGLEAVEKTQELKPDILLLDLTLPFLNGLDILSRLKRQHRTKILVVSMHADEPSVIQALRLGARGYILKESPAKQLITAIKMVHEGGTCVSPALDPMIQRVAIRRASGLPQQDDRSLTPREILVLRQVASGKSSAQIAAQLGISKSTVAKHRSHIVRKTHARTQAGVMLYALRHQIIKA